MKIYFGFQPRPNRFPGGPNQRPARRIPPSNHLPRNQGRDENLKEEEESQEAEEEEEEDSFYDDDFFTDPDFDNFDFSDFEEFEVYDENAEEPSVVERETNEAGNATSFELKERKEMDFNYSREGLELYKKSRDGQNSHREPPATPGEQQGFKEDFKFDFENSADFEKYHKENNDEEYNEVKDQVSSRLEERFKPQANEEDYEEFEDFFTSFEPFGFDELPAGDLDKHYQAEDDLDKLNLVTDMFETDMKSPAKV